MSEDALCNRPEWPRRYFFFFFNDTATTEIYTLSLHDALPISQHARGRRGRRQGMLHGRRRRRCAGRPRQVSGHAEGRDRGLQRVSARQRRRRRAGRARPVPQRAQGHGGRRGWLSPPGRARAARGRAGRRAGQVPTRTAGEPGGRERLLGAVCAPSGGTARAGGAAAAAHLDPARRELRDRPVGADARLLPGAGRRRGVARGEPGDPDRSRGIHRQHRDEVLEPAPLAGACSCGALLPGAQRCAAGPHGGQGVRRVGLRRAERHRRRAGAEPSRGAAQASLTAVVRRGAPRYLGPPMRHVPVLALGALVAISLPSAAQHPLSPSRRPAPSRRRPASTAAARIPPPRAVLGFEPGEDRRLADWPTLVRYYQALAKASDRVRYHELGRTTLGAPFLALAISSPQNLRLLDRYRELNAKLADPRVAGRPQDLEEALRTGKTIVLITSGIHSNEVGGHLTPALLAYRLASDTGAATRAILDNVILWLVPSLNPDGVTIVANWYGRTVGTPAEGTDPPELYHAYVGHDNNRDWYAFTQVETQLVVDSIHNVWHPQIVHDIHQQDSDGSRLFLPPYLDPIEPNVDPLLVDGVNALGTAMAWELAGEGKTGIAINAIYDAWTPARAYQHYHGGVRILSEAASANLASPIDIPFEQLATRARGFNPRERSWNFSHPRPAPAGGSVGRGGHPWGRSANPLPEPRRYPARPLSPGAPPLPPYDVTAHTLPLLMGVTSVAAHDSLRIALSSPVEPPSASPSAAGFAGPEAPRVGLYRSYAAAIDEGWTRWVFDTWKVPYTSIVDSVVRAGKLRAMFDVIVLPDQSPPELLDGVPREYPAPYPGGLGEDGGKALRHFAEDGGTLVALNDASRFAVQQFLLPVRNVLEGVADDEFYAPGSIFRLELDPSDPIARGMPAQSVAWYESGPAFEVLDSSAVRVVGRYPTDPDKVLLSGWALHPDRVAGRAALVEVKVGQGRVVLFGFRPQYRGQSIATYPLLFNSLQLTSR